MAAIGNAQTTNGASWERQFYGDGIKISFRMLIMGAVALFVAGAIGCSGGLWGQSEWEQECIEASLAQQSEGRRFSSYEKESIERICGCMHDYLVEVTDPPFPPMTPWDPIPPAGAGGGWRVSKEYYSSRELHSAARYYCD